MKHLLLKTIFSMVFLFGISNFVNAQSRTCDPILDPDYCTPACTMIVDGIVNNTDCDLTFLWQYQGSSCAGFIGAGEVKAGAAGTPAFPWVGQCRKFCDDPCECPIGFWFVNPSNPSQKTVIAQTAAFNQAPGSVTTYCNLQACNSGSCVGPIKVVMTVTTTGRATFVFSCISGGTCP